MNTKTYLYWPVRLAWKSKRQYSPKLLSWFSWHGWQVGWKGVGHGVFGWTLHFGRFLIKFGGDVMQ